MSVTEIRRVSTSGQDFSTQAAGMLFHGLKVTKVVEVKASAFKVNPDGRPTKLDKTITDVIAAQPEAVVIRRIDRLSRRGIEHGLSVVRRFKEAGIPLWSDMGEVTKMNALVLAAMFEVAYQESLTKQGRTFDMHRVIADNGAWVGTPKTGYVIEGTGTRNARLVIDPAGRRRVVLIFLLCTRGMSTAQIGARFGVEATTIGDILRCESYATGKTQLSSKQADGEKAREWTHEHPRLISQRLFDRARSALASRRTTAEVMARDTSLDRLEGAVLCGQCGGGKVRLYLHTQRHKAQGGGVRECTRYRCKSGHGAAVEAFEAWAENLSRGYMVTSVEVTTDGVDEASALRDELRRCDASTDGGFNRIVAIRERLAELESGDGSKSEPRNLIWVAAADWQRMDWTQRRAWLSECGAEWKRPESAGIAA